MLRFSLYCRSFAFYFKDVRSILSWLLSALRARSYHVSHHRITLSAVPLIRIRLTTSPVGSVVEIAIFFGAPAILTIVLLLSDLCMWNNNNKQACLALERRPPAMRMQKQHTFFLDRPPTISMTAAIIYLSQKCTTL